MSLMPKPRDFRWVFFRKPYVLAAALVKHNPKRSLNFSNRPEKSPTAQKKAAAKGTVGFSGRPKC